MTYAEFHLVFVLPPIALLIWKLRRIDLDQFKKLVSGIGFVASLALLYTTPWDNYLVKNEIWSYPPERVWASIGYVPVEEYLFFVLMTLLTGLWTFVVLKAHTQPLANVQRPWPRIGGAGFWLAITVWGVIALRNSSTFYLALILSWAGPVLAMHWAYGGDWMWRQFRIWLFAVGFPTVYLCLADLYAIRDGIWKIHTNYTTGLMIFDLPVEEATFFLIANILVVQGTWTFWSRWDLTHAPAHATKGSALHLHDQSAT